MTATSSLAPEADDPRRRQRSAWVLAGLWLLVALAVRLPARDTPGRPAPAPARTAAWLAGVAAAPAAVAAAATLSGPAAAGWAGGLLALAPIHVLASRGGRPETLLVLLELVGLASFGWLDRRRRAAAGLLGLAVLLGQASWLVSYSAEAWVPATTPLRLVRCSVASLTRVLGIEYQLVVPHSRYALPLTALVVALALRGAARLPGWRRGLLVVGAVAPFVLGATLALASGSVAPLQAQRLVVALPCWALLVAAGLASLAGARGWAAGSALLGSLAAFLALALAS